MSIPQPVAPRALWILAFVSLAGLAIGWFLYGPHIIDDAYITFRYSRNLAAGEGLVFQAGQRVLGFSSPLWMFVLSIVARVGISVPGSSLVLSYAFFAVTGWQILRVGLLTGHTIAGWLAIAFLTTSVFFQLILISGMETMLYTAVTLALLGVVMAERWKHVGWLAGLVLLTRYDGLVTVVLAYLWILRMKGYRTTFRQGFITAAIYLPWFGFSAWYFGSPTPQTVVAKRVVHYVDWEILFRHYLPAYLSSQPLWPVWLTAAAFGGFRIARRNFAHAILPVWVVVFGGTFLVARMAILGFIWYLVPLFPVIFHLAIVGIMEATEFLRCQHARGAALAIFALLFFFQLWFFVSRSREFGNSVLNREEAYRINAQYLNGFVQKGDTILVGEVGALGWYLQDATIIDGYGLVSPTVSDIRRENRAWMLERGLSLHDHPDGTVEATVEMVRRLNPSFITSRNLYLCMEEAQRDPMLVENYSRLTAPDANVHDQVTLVKKDLLPRLKGLQTKPL